MYYSRKKVYSITINGIIAKDLEDVLGTRLSQGRESATPALVTRFSEGKETIINLRSSSRNQLPSLSFQNNQHNPCSEVTKEY